MPTSEKPAAGPALVPDILERLRAGRSPRDVEGQRRFGIRPQGEHLGLPMPALRTIAREHRRDHALALALWETGVHEARLLAALVADPDRLTIRTMTGWARGFDTWATVDNACIHLFRKSPHAAACARTWIPRHREYVRRAGLVLVATLAVHDRSADDRVFLDFLPAIRSVSTDDRNFVRKAASWALRQIGKRNARLRRSAIAEARRILKLNTPSARWIARDALRELAPVRGRAGSC
ncbi:DNA alkylation repair enzyme [mine drainage metagenome]|uniref:DNA alkylation repair enzyme n=1 Tax=mine drainage metagenome TaxID=410659 RepID=A0A1J5SA44_9ZZZZ